MAHSLDWLADVAHRLLVGVHRLLNPVAAWVDTIGFAARAQMDRWHVPFAWQGWLVAAAWAVLAVVLLRLLRGWWRIGAAVVVLVVLVRHFRVLPGV